MIQPTKERKSLPVVETSVFLFDGFIEAAELKNNNCDNSYAISEIRAF